MKNRQLTPEQSKLLKPKTRFGKNMNRHKDLKWEKSRPNWKPILKNYGL
jgi:hypothetical protein